MSFYLSKLIFLELSKVQLTLKKSHVISISRRKKRTEPKKEKLKIHQKIEIVNKIIDETNQNIDVVHQEHEGKLELIECKLEQFDEQMKDIQKQSLEFEREFSKLDKKEKVNSSIQGAVVIRLESCVAISPIT